MTSLRIAQLYPDLLGVTGDRGNVDVLAARAVRAGHEAHVHRVGIGDDLPADVDIVVIGNGPLSAMRVVVDDLRSRRPFLAELLAAGGVLFAVGGGAELLSERVELRDGSTLDGLGLLPVRVARIRTRKVGYIVADTPDGRLTGFEDHASEWTIGAEAPDDAVYATVIAGSGSGSDGQGARFEGVRVGGLHASNVQGPALPLNPQWADALLARACARRGGGYTPAPQNAQTDGFAASARAEIERLATTKHFTAIEL